MFQGMMTFSRFGHHSHSSFLRAPPWRMSRRYSSLRFQNQMAEIYCMRWA